MINYKVFVNGPFTNFKNEPVWLIVDHYQIQAYMDRSNSWRALWQHDKL